MRAYNKEVALQNATVAPELGEVVPDIDPNYDPNQEVPTTQEQSTTQDQITNQGQTKTNRYL